MSITSRSQSSSPDILGPPGDAEYLISSPIKPFAGRQSWMSPANLSRQQTPAKRPRVSLSPAKSAHSIRFDDVLLPGSPTMKLNGRQRSLSPEKLQPDGNVSPWRIRVTLEATQDEENETQGSPARKRLRPSTTTTKIPLKDDRSPLQEKTPARRRGRPRKSDLQAQNGSPWPGSPGNTPAAKGGSSQKGKRGRPRKGTPKPKSQEMVEVEDEPTPALEPEPDIHFSPMDMAADGDADPPRQWSPMNLAADGLDSDSLGADDLPVADLRAPTPAANRDNWDNTRRDFGRASYDTPVIGAMEHHFHDHDENIHSTPSKMPSPTRERSASSARSSRHAGSNSPPRTYPTPTPTSSLVEEENQNGEAHVDQRPVTNNHHPQPETMTDPTNEHEGYDSIMESEGFTMISLDTLPSARQHGLGSSARTGTDNSSGQRENGRIGERLKRKLPGGINDLRNDNQSSTRPSPVAVDPSPRSHTLARAHLKAQNPTRQSSAEVVSYPELPAPSPEKTRGGFDFDQEPAMRQSLAEEGEGTDNEEAEGAEAPMDGLEEEVDGDEEGNLIEEDEVHAVNPSPRFEQREPLAHSPAALGRLPREEEWRLERQAVSRQARDPINSQRLISIDSDGNASQDESGSKDSFDDRSQSDAQSILDEEPLDERPLDDEPRNEEPPDEEPQDMESEHVAEPFPIVEPASEMEQEAYDEADDESVDIWQQEPQYSEREHVLQPWSTNDQATEMEQDVLEDNDDDGFDDDIWQQEARDHSHLSQHSDDRAYLPAEASTRAWTRITGNSANQNHLSSSPAYVTMEHHDAKYLEPTHVRKLRDEEVDLSALLAEEDTPNRARYYNGTSTPRSILSRRSGAQQSSIDGSAVRSASRMTGQRTRLQPISQSSPHRESEGELDSPAATHQRSQLESQPGEVNEIDSASDADPHETESVHADSVATPNPPRQPDGDPEAPSWFQRITSLTPRWLKAPARSRDDSSSPVSENESAEEDDQEDQEELASIESAKEIRDHLEHAPLSNRSSESPPPLNEPFGDPPSDDEGHASSVGEEEEEEEEEEEDEFMERSLADNIVEDDAASLVDDDHVKFAGPRPLAVFGYFSDDHYKALRRVYRMATRHPERFPYHDAPGRAQIIGDWIWTSDGHHGVPITELQFAIIDRFVLELSRADVQYNGSGQVDWTEADLHRRLISIIIGEQIREEQKAKAARGASVDTWR